MRPGMALAFLVGSGPARADAAETLVLEDWQSVGISGFRDAWGKSDPGARVADAVHRALLLRFPKAAEPIAEHLRDGAQIKKAELVFAYDGHELAPPKYTVRTSRGRSKWENDPPRWHYIAFPLRRPWTAEPESRAPTFNAWLDGAGYWRQYGGKDEQADRYPTRLGPTELSQQNTEGRMDVTPLLREPRYGDTIGKRLRNFAAQGLLLKKWETYDLRYMGWSAYEWAVATGGHGLRFEDVRLEIELTDGKARSVTLPEAPDFDALAEQIKGTERGGEPTAVMPGPERIEKLARQAAFQRPEWMPDWQWQRVQELRELGGGDIHEISTKLASGDPAEYQNVVDTILSQPPRYWRGWNVQNDLLTYFLYAEMLPSHVVDHMKNYWESWLYPDLPNEKLPVSPQGQEKMDWWEQHKDWRGRFSFFRKRWTQGIGTMNFNHTANMGALLGGAILDAEHPMRDGRDGLEKVLLKTWNFKEGTSQEMLDDYYFSITLSGQKMFSDFGPSRVDRLMGDMIRNRAVELLASSFHPHVRRLVGPGGRVRLSNLLGYEQEGVYSVLHTLTPEGVLFHPEAGHNAKQHGMHLYGYDFPPGRVALQSITGPWLPAWSRHWLEDKPLPFRVTAAETTRGTFTDPPLWRRAYLGHTYAIASHDIMQATADVTAQWHGGETPPADADQLGTLTLRYNVNQPRMAETHGGQIGYTGGLASFQQDNRLIVASKPPHAADRINELAGDDGLKQLYTSIALWNFADDPGWEIYVDGQRVDACPVSLESGQKITIKDGDTYLGIIPLPATDLGRDQQVMIERGQPERLGDRHDDVKIAPALMVNAYNMNRAEPAEPSEAEWSKITNETHGGFVIEMGERQANGSFKAFQQRIHEAEIRSRWGADKRVLHLGYRSAGDEMEMGFGVAALQPDPPHYAQQPGKHEEAIPYRRFNGEEPYLPDGILRDTTLTQQGTAGRLVKQGAELRVHEGHMAYLQTEPVSGTYVGFNPFPELTRFTLTAPGGVRVTADGPIGLARVSVQPETGRLRIDQAYRENQVSEDIAERLLVFGLEERPTVELNGRSLKQVERTRIDGEPAYLIPLDIETE
jgi:hypothetical protein